MQAIDYFARIMIHTRTDYNAQCCVTTLLKFLNRFLNFGPSIHDKQVTWKIPKKVSIPCHYLSECASVHLVSFSPTNISLQPKPKFYSGLFQLFSLPFPLGESCSLLRTEESLQVRKLDFRQVHVLCMYVCCMVTGSNKCKQILCRSLVLQVCKSPMSSSRRKNE